MFDRPRTPNRRPDRTRIALRGIFAMLAMIAQCVLVVSAIGEGRAGIGAAAHVESSTNTTTHYAHDEATCAACQARTLVGTPLGHALPTFVSVEVHEARTLAPALVPAAAPLTENPSRAPPLVI